MKLATGLLYDLARSTDVERLGELERILEVPPMIAPVAAIPLAQLDTLTFNVLDVQRTSFFQHAAVIRTNQAEVFVGFATLGRGLWELTFEVWYASNFDAFTAGGNGYRVLIGQTAASLRPLLAGEPKVTPGTVTSRLVFRALLPVDGWVIQLTHFTTGVGQTGHVKLSLWAAKLL